MSSESQLRDSVTAYAKDAIPIASVRKAGGSLPGFDTGRWTAMADFGWAGVVVAEEFGGVGLGMAEACAIAEELGRTLSPEPFCATAVLAATALSHADGPRWKARLLRELAGGKSVIALAAAIGPSARRADGCPLTVRTTNTVQRLDGRARFVVPGGADGFVVEARALEGPELYWVPAGSAGLEVEQAWQADGTPSATIHLNGVEVPMDNRLAAGDVAQLALQRAADAGTIAACAALLGTMRGTLQLTLEYMRTRMQFGRPIGGFQALQHRAVDMYIQQELAACALADAVSAADSAAPAHVQGKAISRAKARCNDAAMLIAREGVQLHGAIGFTEDSDVGLYLKRTIVLSQWLGGSAEHRLRYRELSTVGENC